MKNSVGQRVGRLMRIAWLIRSSPAMNTFELAEEFQVSRRTILRDLKTLRSAGVEVKFDTDVQAYQMRGQREVGQAPIDDRGLAMLALAAHVSPLYRVGRIAKEIRSTLANLASQLPECRRREIGRLMRSCTIVPPPGCEPANCSGILDLLLSAIRDNHKVRLTFRTIEHEPRQTKMAPYRLEISPDRYWIVGRSSAHRRVCRFDLAEIQYVEVINEPYAIPIGFKGISSHRLPLHDEKRLAQ